jgi:hypothetical protein
MMDQPMSVQQLWQLCVDLVEPLQTQPTLGITEELEPFASQRSDAITHGRVVIEHPPTNTEQALNMTTGGRIS